MFGRTDGDAGRTEGAIADRRFAPAAPALVWGLLMTTAIAGAAATVWLGSRHSQTSAAVARRDDTLHREVARLSAERQALAARLALLERGVGELKLAQRGVADPVSTGAISRSAPAIDRKFGLTLGTEESPEAAKRRWDAVLARHPNQLGRLAPLARRDGSASRWDVVAGPFATRGEAEVGCVALAEQGLACDITDYAGEPIARP